MVCPKCNNPIDEETVFCGNCGTQVAPLYARGATVVESTEKISPNSVPSGSPLKNDARARQASFPPVSIPPAQFSPPPTQTGRGDAKQVAAMPLTPAPPQRSRRLNIGRATFLISMLMVLVIAVTAGTVVLLRGSGTAQKSVAANGGNQTIAPGVVTTGQVSFADGPGGQQTAAIKISAVGLSAPASGSHYDGWLVDETTEQHIVFLGALTAQDKSYVLSFAGNANVLGEGNKIEVTLEQGDVQVPSGKVVLTATFPALAFVHIKHLLLAFTTTPHNVGLLVGLREQARLLNSEAVQLQQAINSGNQGSVRSVAQAMLDVIEGQNGPNARPLQGNVPFPNIAETGDGFGLLGQNGYINLAKIHASLAATQPDSTDSIKVHAGHVGIAMKNIAGWVTTVDNDVQGILANPGNTGKIQEIVTLAEHAINGVDIDGDESIDPVPGEAGAVTAYAHGQLMAGLALHP